MTRRVAVVICAYTLDRWDDLVSAVGSAQAQQPAPERIVLVVDHNEDLLQQARATWPRHPAQPVQVIANQGSRGLSGARNTGIAAAAQADVIAFLDDDACARTGWLAQLVAPFADPTVVATGGRAAPRWPAGRRPATLPSELLWVVGCTFTGQPTELAEIRNVMGCSMAVRTSVFHAVGGFTENIGRTAVLPLGCEETELCIRARQHDPAARVMFVPQSVVDHRVGPQRTSWSYLRRRSYAEGISKAAVAALVGAGDALSTERAYTRSVLPRGVVRELAHGRPAGALAIVVSLASAAVGYLRGKRTAVTPEPAPQQLRSAA